MDKLVKIAGSWWMLAASNRDNWRSMREPYVPNVCAAVDVVPLIYDDDGDVKWHLKYDC